MKTRQVCYTAAAIVGLALAINAGVPRQTSAAPNPAPSAAPSGAQRVVLAGGCFWGMQAIFQSLKGVTAVAGYSGGAKQTAQYEVVSTGTTGHAESVEVTYDPKRITFANLLDVYFLVAHDPTELNRQGPDEGSQYRSAIFYTTPAQHDEAVAYVRHLTATKRFDHAIVTQIVPFHAFYPAEDYHQNYVRDHPDQPYVAYNDLPKLDQLHQRYPALVQATPKP